MAPNLYLKLETFPNAEITASIREAIEASERIGLPVQFIHNNVTLYVRGDSNKLEVYLAWCEETKSDKEIKTVIGWSRS